MSNEKTLATVKHGGCVQLGDWLLPCPFCGERAERIDFGPGSGDNEGGSCVACTVCQHSGPVEFGYKENFISNWNRRALSAQPSPGGEGDACIERAAKALHAHGADNLCNDVLWDDLHQPEADQFRSWARAALVAARQPVGEPDHLRGATEMIGQPMGEPVAYTSETQLKALRVCGDGIMSQRNAKWNIPLYTAPPAQAVGLPYSLDADPAGIRARVADVITGTLMVGAQGHTPPPGGHWAEPFWKAARADATAQAVDLGPAVIPDTPEVRDILGRPNFWCSPWANVLRMRGDTIPLKAEEEQAAVIRFMLNHYLANGADWVETAGAELDAIRKADSQDSRNG